MTRDFDSVEVKSKEGVFHIPCPKCGEPFMYSIEDSTVYAHPKCRDMRDSAQEEDTYLCCFNDLIRVIEICLELQEPESKYWISWEYRFVLQDLFKFTIHLKDMYGRSKSEGSSIQA